MGCIGSRTGFLSRLARDVRGNTLAIMAAALIPLAGLIGGGVDMSRLYLVKTRLQQACDAGALAGRKAMGPDSWSEGSNNGSTNDKAEKMFGANFSSGQYGSSALTKSFSESNGIVSGEARLTMPMTIMKIFGMTSRTISVTCQAKMELPNTDVMFVLDVTGSMNCVAGSAYCPGGNNNNVPAAGSKILGLKSAVKCFYEALLKVNTTEVCGNDPTATTSTTTAQIRIGFVPYSVSVNVGRLLPNAYMANNWTYQSRAANTSIKYAYTLGTESAVSGWASWSPSSTPNSFNTASGFSGFATAPGSVQIPAGGTTYALQRSDIKSQTNCDSTGLNTLAGSSNTLVAREDLPGTIGSSASPTTPTYPQTTQTITYTETDPRIVNGYRYKWKKNGYSSNSCWLEKATGTYNRTRTGGTSTKAISWDTAHPYTVADGTYSYQPISQPVSGLKAGGSSWNNTVSIPNLNIGTTTLPSPIYLSGSLTATSSIQTPASATVTWDGCIEERQTFKNSDYDPSNEWSPIPSTAFDMNIDLLPDLGTTGTVWGPALQNAVWARYNPQSITNCTTSNGDAFNTVNTACDLSHNTSYYCTTPASKLTVYNTATNFETYVNSLTAIGNTYHDIGMLWGARLISPTGIFASENSAAPGSGPIQRHIIFMTDGDTMTDIKNYTSYGVGWWDRRQTTYAPSGTDLNNIVNARLEALCTAVKNMNITLWVISYGGGISTTTENRLKRCSTGYNTTTQQPDGVHYASASDTAALVAQFQNIAAKISELRLTH